MSGAVEGVALLPCPFCGWSAGNSVMDSGDEPYWVECADCYAQSGVAETRDAAITAWNTRTTPPARSYADGVRAVLEQQMEDQDEDLPSSMARERGLVWLEGWFDLEAAIRLLSQGGKA